MLSAELLLLMIGRAGVLSSRPSAAGEERLLGPMFKRQQSDLRRATDIDYIIESGAIFYWPRTANITSGTHMPWRACKHHSPREHRRLIGNNLSNWLGAG